jgi:hypothetical protein
MTQFTKFISEFKKLILAILPAALAIIIISLFISTKTTIISNFLPSLTTLLAAFFGAWFAFRLQNQEKEKQERMKKINIINQTLFTLFKQVNILRLIQKNFIDPHRETPGFFIAMQPIHSADHTNVKFNFEDLAFILDTKYRNMLSDLFIEEERFKETIKAINYRSSLHIDEVQPKLSVAGTTEGLEYSSHYFEKALGPFLYANLKLSTEQMISQIDLTVDSLQVCRDSVLVTFNKLFPDADLLTFELTK